MKYVYVNNEFVPQTDAVIGLGDLALQRSYAVFDFLTAHNQVPLFLDDYVNRFFNSAAELKLLIKQTKEEVKGLIKELLHKNKYEHSGVRMLFTGGYSKDGYSIAESNFILMEQPLASPAASAYEDGISIITYPHQRELPQIKTINYIMAVWLQPLLKEKAAADVLYHHQNIITELPRCNIFIVQKDGKVYTPKNNVLHGITRSKILQLNLPNISIAEKEILTLEDVYAAEEIFLTSTSKKVLPICIVDDKRIGSGKPGAVTQQIARAFDNLREEYFENNKVDDLGLTDEMEAILDER